MPPEIIKEYWENAWAKRMKPCHSPSMNYEKMAKVVYELMLNERLREKEKLDIGCGTAIHAVMLSLVFDGWRKHYTGIDLSETATNFPKSLGFNVQCLDFYDFIPDRKYEVFILLDSLEHFMDHPKLASKIKELATDNFIIWGNVPLYCGKQAHEEGIERIVNTEVISDFLRACGMQTSRCEIYGIAGLPYMIFEGEK